MFSIVRCFPRGSRLGRLLSRKAISSLKYFYLNHFQSCSWKFTAICNSCNGSSEDQQLPSGHQKDLRSECLSTGQFSESELTHLKLALSRSFPDPKLGLGYRVQIVDLPGCPITLRPGRAILPGHEGERSEARRCWAMLSRTRGPRERLAGIQAESLKRYSPRGLKAALKLITLLETHCWFPVETRGEKF